MAYIRRLPSGKYQATVRHPAGHKVTRTDLLKRVVKAWADETETAFRTGLTPAVRGQSVRLDDWHARWLKSRMVEASTARKDDSRWRNHVQPHWGRWPLDTIKREDVQEWVKAMVERRVGPSAVHGSYELLATMLTEAADRGFIPASPCRKITLPREGRPEPRWLTRHEYDRLQLSLAEATTVLGGRVTAPDPHAPVWQALVGLGCFTGLRPGELAGLDVEHIDFDRRLVRVRQVLARLEQDNGGHYFGIRRYPKSDRSRRTVPFPAEVGDLLWRVLADRTCGPVFTAQRGGRVMVESNWSRRVWAPALERAGIEYVRPYVMRHTCASWLVQKGVPDRKIMAILGHADGHLIELYAHLAPDAHDEVRAAWGDAPPAARRTGGARPHGGEVILWETPSSEGHPYPLRTL